MQELTKALSLINGVVAVGLGGSRGLGIADENSDYDFVLFRSNGKPIAVPLIMDILKSFTDSANIREDAGFVVAQVSGKKIEIFQKDLSQVAREIAIARNGNFHWSIRPLFPHGDLSTGQISHIIYLQLCSEKEECVTNLRRLAEPFPDLLMRSLIKKFLAQATITVIHASKIKKTVDVQYLLALCSGFVFYTNIVIFSINRKYPVIERGGAKIILGLPLQPKNYEQRKSSAFQAAFNGNFELASSELSSILEELKALANTATEDLPQLQNGQQLSIPQAMHIAAQQIDEGQLMQAETTLQQILQQQPHHAGALHLMGVAAHQAGNTALAIELIGKAIQVQPNAAQFHANRGEMCRILNRSDEAIHHGERAIALMPNIATYHSNLGIAYFDKKNYARAETCQQKALQLEPTLVQALNNLGSIRSALKDHDGAIEYYRKVLEFAPNHYEAMNNLNLTYMEQDRLAE